MEHERISPEITVLDRVSLNEAIGVLSKAFANDPMMQYIFGPSIAAYSRSLYEMFRFSCEVRLMLNWPLLGCWDARCRLVGVAGLSPRVLRVEVTRATLTCLNTRVRRGSNHDTRIT